MLPSQEGLGTDRSALMVNLQLIVQAKLFVPNGLTQRSLRSVAPYDGVKHPKLKGPDTLCGVLAAIASSYGRSPHKFLRRDF